MGDRGFYWQQDNAPVHGPAKWHIAQEVLVVNWPTHSPDFNPIEMVWTIIKRNLCERKFADKEELFKAAQEEWTKIHGHVIRNLVGSFLTRCQVCVELNGSTIMVLV
jgi:transposase